MFSWFTSKSVERTQEVLQNPFSVYDLTFLEWEQRVILLRDEKVIVCTENNRKDKKFELIFKKDRLSTFSLYRDIDREPVEEVYNSVKLMLNLLSDGITSKKPRIIAPILKDVVEYTRAHPNWTSCHIAAKIGLNQLFIQKKAHIVKNLNSQSPPDMLTPFHLAIESGKLDITKSVLALKPQMVLKDSAGNAPIHLAAMSDKEILSLMLKEPNVLEMLKWKNEKKCTPLHLACYSSKFENVIQLLEFGLTVQMMTVSIPGIKVKTNKYSEDIIKFKKEDIEDLDLEDMEFGGTPLHWAKHRRALERLIGFGFGLDVINANRETALHTMVRRMRLKCMIGLLCFGAKVSKVDRNGDSPLHCAVRGADLTSTQALIIFDSNINRQNHKKESPRHIAAQLENTDHHMVLYLLTAIGAERCSETMINCKEGCAHKDNYEGRPYHRWPTYENECFYRPVLLEHIIREAIQKKKDNSSAKVNGARLMCLDGLYSIDYIVLHQLFNF